MRASIQPVGAAEGPSTLHDLVFFVALMSTAIALGGALAHLLELPNKIGLPRDEYFIVQKAYRGWSQLGYLLVIELASMLALCALYRRRRRVLWPSLVALLGLVGSQIVFWAYTFPANTGTRDWTFMPENWETMRRQWEFSHAAGAAFQLLAMAALIVAVLARSRGRDRVAAA